MVELVVDVSFVAVVEIESETDFEITTSDKLSDSDNLSELSLTFKRGEVDVEVVADVELLFLEVVAVELVVESVDSLVCVFD